MHNTFYKIKKIVKNKKKLKNILKFLKKYKFFFRFPYFLIRKNLKIIKKKVFLKNNKR
jgi:hypothetical protein